MAFTGTKSREIIAEEIFKEQQAEKAAAPNASQQKKVGSSELEAALRNAIIIRAVWMKGSEYWHRADAICVAIERALQRI
jgi:alkylhydroperoxidase family enzyme